MEAAGEDAVEVVGPDDGEAVGVSVSVDPG